MLKNSVLVSYWLLLLASGYWHLAAGHLGKNFRDEFADLVALASITGNQQPQISSKRPEARGRKPGASGQKVVTI